MTFIRKTLFWVITLVFLGGMFQLLNQKTEENRLVEEVNLRLFPFTSEKVTAFWIETRENGVRLRVVRKGDGWQFVVPLDTPGDGKVIDKLLVNILKARKDAILFDKPTPEKLQELGLEVPELGMGFETEGATSIIRFGDKGPTNNVAYAKFDDDPRVLRIHSDVKQEADQSIYALRDKTVLAFDPLRTVRLEITRQRSRVVVRHNRGKWDMIEPVQARAAMANVLETMYTIKNSEIKAFIDENPTDLHLYGLENPAITFAVLDKDEKKPQHLLIGSKDRSRRGYFAQRAGSVGVFLVEEELVHALMADAAKWREG